MDARMSNLEDMNEAELRELINTAQETLDRMIARRAKQTLKEARRLAAEVGFEVSFTKAAQPEGRTKGTRGKARTPPRPGRAAAGRRGGCRQRWLVVGRWTTCRSRQQTEQAEPPSTAEARQQEAQNSRTAPQRPSWCFIGPMCRQLPSSSLRSADPRGRG